MTTSFIRIALCTSILCIACGSRAVFADDDVVVTFQMAVEAVPENKRADNEQEAEDPQVAAMRAQVEPWVQVELSFANRACDWTDQQRDKAIADARTWLGKYLRQHRNQNQLINNGFVLFAGNQIQAVDHTRSEMEKELVQTLKNNMSTEQLAAYSAQREKRDAFRKETIIENIVAKIDEHLDLTPEQSARIRKSMNKKWNDDLAPTLHVLTQMSNYLPAVPDNHVVPFLTSSQRTAWKSIQKISARGMAFAGGVFGQNQTIDDIDIKVGQ